MAAKRAEETRTFTLKFTPALNNYSQHSTKFAIAGLVCVLLYVASEWREIGWEEAVEFCRLLSNLPEEKSAQRMYRLPTEAEWEYACRASGGRTLFHYGDKLTHAEANFMTEYPFASQESKASLGRPVARERSLPRACPSLSPRPPIDC